MKYAHLLLVIMLLGMGSSMAYADVPPPPPGGYAGGVFSQYFENIIEGASPTGSCLGGQGIVGFDTSSSLNYGKPICANLGMATGNPGQTFVYSGGLGWIATDGIFHKNGNVGIGTIDPTGVLHLSSSKDNIIDFQSTDNTWLYSQWKDNTGTRRAWMGLGQTLDTFNVGMDVGTTAFNVWNWEGSTSNLFNVQRTTGNVGIGAINPSSILEAYSTTAPTFRMKTNNNASNGVQFGFITGGSKDSEMWNWENGYFRIGTNNAERMRIDSSGNVGIGTNIPGAKLDVFGGIQTTNGMVYFKNTSAGTQHQIFNYYTPGNPDNGAWYFGASRDADNSRNEITFYNLSCSPDTPGGTNYNCNVPKINMLTDVVNVSGLMQSPKYAALAQGIAPVTTGAPDAKIFSPSGDYIGINTWGISYDEGSPDYIKFQNSNSVTSQIALDNGAAHFGLGGGNVGIGTSTPSPLAKLEVNGQVKITGGTPGAGKVLTSDASGLASWTTPAGGLTIEDTRAAQRTPNAYDDYRTSYEFTNQITGLGGWQSAMTLQGWHDGYAAWQIIGPATTSADENWYLRSGINTSWNPIRTIIHSGNIGSQSVATATTFSSTRSTYKGVTDNAVAGQLMWKNYGNSHTIFDASAGTSPDGGSVNNTNSAVPWSATYPTLMGWNGSSTYGVRVDSSRVADTTFLLSKLDNYVWSATTLPTGYPQGVQSSFVSAYQGFPNYGSVLTMNTYPAGGGALQLYTPYSPTYGGNGLQVRFGNYDVNSGNAWTTWKTLLASDNFNTYAPTLNGVGAYGTWGISINGNASTVGGLSVHSGRNNEANKVVRTDSNGSIQTDLIYANSFNYSSDRSLKKDITPLSQSLENIKKLNGYSFAWKKDGRKDIGVIAQEVEKVFPDIVHTDTTGTRSVEYGNLVAPLIESTKELADMHDVQEKRIQAQQQEIAELKQELAELRRLIEKK